MIASKLDVCQPNETNRALKACDLPSTARTKKILEYVRRPNNGGSVSYDLVLSSADDLKEYH